MNRREFIGGAAATLAVLLAGGGRAAPFAMPELKEPMIPSRTFCISDYGAKAGGLDCTKAFARAMSACEFAGGGHVVVPPGRWTVGPIRLVSNCDLHLSEGAVLEFTDNPADYLPPVKTTWEGVECMGYSPLVYAYAATNVSITGSGTLAPRMDLWRRWFERGAGARVAMENLYGWCSTNAPVASRDVTAIPDNRMRPQLIQMNRSANVLLDGFRIRESPFWTIHLYLCENCIVRNVDSVAHGTNSDGVDIDMTRNVLIENCRFDQGDDGIVLKAGRNADGWRLNRPTENVVVTNCTFAFAHTLLGIGSELSGGIRNIWMADCRIGSTYNMIYIKTNRRRGGFVENVWVDRVICDGDVRSAVVGIDMNVLYQWAVLPDYELRYTPIRNINLSNVTAKSADWAVDLRGDVHQPPEGIRIGNLDVGSFRSGEKRVENCRNVVATLLALSAGAALQDECQRLVDEAVASGEQGGVQFCAYKDGKCIVDVCAGHLATNANAAPVRSDSLFPIFSTEKPLLATAVHRAVEKGRMDYDKPLCTWWPELKGKGKERLTLRETLGYRTGMNGGRPKCYTNDIECCDWERTWRSAAAEDPEIEPGTRQRYLPRAYAWMLGHPLEVAMDRPLKEVLDEEILIPAGISDEFYFVADESLFPRIATFYRSPYCEVMNNDWARKALLPSSFAVASARAVARFYNRLCGYDGKPPLIRPETLEAALKPCRHPSDPLPDAETMKRDWFMIFGMGYGLWGDAERIGRVFGHGGAGGSEGLVDRDQKLVVAFTCNFDNYKGGLRQRLYDAVGMWWRYSKDRDADIQTLQMRTKDRK